MQYRIDGLKFSLECPVCHEMHNLILLLKSSGKDHEIKCNACGFVRTLAEVLDSDA